MGNSYKAILGLALAMPMLAYIAGSLAAAQSPTADRAPIVFTESSNTSSADQVGAAAGEAGDVTDPGSAPEDTSPSTPKPDPSPKPAPKKKEPQVVTPRPNDLGSDDDDDDDDDSRDSDDDSWDDETDD